MSSRDSNPTIRSPAVDNDNPYSLYWTCDPLPDSTPSSSQVTDFLDQQRFGRRAQDLGLDDPSDHDRARFRSPPPQVDLQFHSPESSDEVMIEDFIDWKTSADDRVEDFPNSSTVGAPYDPDLGQDDFEGMMTAFLCAKILPNPFDGQLARSLVRYNYRQSDTTSTAVGEVNGYVKCLVDPVIAQCSPVHRVYQRHSPVAFMEASIPYMPENFGIRWNPDGLDRELLQFYARAFCTGRTLLDRSNAYLQIMRMVDDSDSVKHAALALAAGYLLDYRPRDQELRARVVNHYQAAVRQLTHDMADPSIQQVGREDSTVGALVLLFSDDIVNWEHREAQLHVNPGVRSQHDPLWRQASRVARRLLDASDPGQRYWQPGNVQVTDIRSSNANMVAYIEICALPVTPLEVQDWDTLFSWLLAGSKRDVQQIHGGTGVSPKLLHVFAQITQLAALSHENPESISYPIAAKQIDKSLDGIVQWSQFNDQGFDNVHDLLRACSRTLDQNGFVNDSATVTDLTGETWRQAARIYLYCRFYRLPRNYVGVQSCLEYLLRCLELMPTSGELFTAQSPFFCVFLAAIVAYKAPHRAVIRTWFETVLSTVGARSSVRPVWRIVQEYWEWADDVLPIDELSIEVDLAEPLRGRYAWWEAVVERLMEREGQLPLG